LAEANGSRDGDLGKSAFPHAVDNFTVFRAEAVIIFIHSQFVAKPD
jgi:hypothetical protein